MKIVLAILGVLSLACALGFAGRIVRLLGDLTRLDEELNPGTPCRGGTARTRRPKRWNGVL